MRADAIGYCRHCDNAPCDCDTHEIHPRFVNANVDPEDQHGFNPVAWSNVVEAEKPVRIDALSGAFWSYESGVWSEDRKVVETVLPRKMGKHYRRPKHLGTVTDMLRSSLTNREMYIHPDQPETRYISLPEGLYNVQTGSIEDHDAEVLTTYQLQVDPVFDEPTPELDMFLDSVLHPGDWERVLDILAYLLMPGNPAQKAVMFTGRGRNGKGVLLQVIESLIGSQNAASVSLQDLGTRFAAADLYGVPINIVGDIDGEHIAHTGRFKQATGGDLLRMDRKHADAFAAKVWAVPVFSANTIPTSADTSHGYLRRWEVVEFPNTFDGSDTGLLDRLLAELPAIAGTLLRHAAADPYQIRTSGPGDRAKAEFANRSDPVRSWLEDSELTGFVERKDAYVDYLHWIDTGNGKTALLKRNFYDRLTAVLGDPKVVRGQRGWTFDT